MPGYRWGRRTLAGLAGILPALSVGPAYAHGFGERYDLPVPLWLYLIGAGAAVACSFVIIGVFLRGTPGLHGYPRFNLLRWRGIRFLAHPVTLFFVKLASALLFALLVLAGVLGDQNPSHNLAPTLVWVIWWVGLAYVSALLGNIWALLNPWKTLFGWAESLYARLDPEGQLSFALPCPPWLGVWPGVTLFGAFAWVELVFPGSAEPWNLSMLVLAYSVVTWAGMLLFGRRVWLRTGECFSLAFGFLSRFSPTEIRVRDAAVCDACPVRCRDRAGQCLDCYECFELAGTDQREWNLRPFAVGLLAQEDIQISQMAFVALLLSTVTFDGLTATPAWAAIANSLYAVFPSALAIGTLGLVTFPLLFMAVYLFVASLMATASGRRHPVETLARTFVYSLVPIALAYHLAHYLSFLLIQGQFIIPLISDPFGYGWNILGTADFKVNIAIVNAKFAWITAVTAIVVGHIIAVYLAHVIALRAFGDRRPAQRSQYPMLALMVGYTMVSLWILAQPIVETAKG